MRRILAPSRLIDRALPITVARSAYACRDAGRVSRCYSGSVSVSWRERYHLRTEQMQYVLGLERAFEPESLAGRAAKFRYELQEFLAFHMFGHGRDSEDLA